MVGCTIADSLPICKVVTCQLQIGRRAAKDRQPKTINVLTTMVHRQLYIVEIEDEFIHS